MFTGLVEAIGAVRDVRRAAMGSVLRIECPWRDLVIGESIAVNGVCLSVVTILADGFTCDASAETLTKTTLGEVAASGAVHLERASRVGDRMGGHIVSGHVDGVGRIASKTPLGEAVRVDFEVPAVLAPFLAPKASITVDGVSLTINGATGNRFDVVLVPITRDKTLLDRKPIGARINLEADVLAKYVARLLGRPGVDGRAPEASDTEVGGGESCGGLTVDTLQRAGYL